MSGANPEKRRFPRIRSDSPVLLKKAGPAEMEQFARTRSLGLGGCQILNEEALGDGTVVELLVSSRGRVFEAFSRIVYEHPRPDSGFEIGVEFISLSPADKKTLETLFEH